MSKESREGILLSVKVISNAKKNEIVGVEGEELKIRIGSIPETLIAT